MMGAMNAPILRRTALALATSSAWERAVSAAPGGRRIAYRLSRSYVAGPTVDDALARAQRLAEAGLDSSIDLFGEQVSDPAEADRVTDEYVALAGTLEWAPANTWLSIDLSHIGLATSARATQARLQRIAAALPDSRRIQVGAEDEHHADAILGAVLGAARAGGAVSATVQANLYRSRADAETLAGAGVPIRLVKGAYAEPADRARPWGEATDLAYLELAHELHSGGAELALATHDPVLREALLRALPDVGVEMLLGVRASDAVAIRARGIPVRIYMPYGDRWFRYAMRRFAESLGA